MRTVSEGVKQIDRSTDGELSVFCDEIFHVTSDPDVSAFELRLNSTYSILFLLSRIGAKLDNIEPHSSTLRLSFENWFKNSLVGNGLETDTFTIIYSLELEDLLDHLERLTPLRPGFEDELAIVGMDSVDDDSTTSRPGSLGNRRINTHEPTKRFNLER